MGNLFRLGVAFGLLLLAGRSAQGVVVYSELDAGELSGESGAPTELGLFMPGSNTVTGQVTAIGSDGSNGTADVFTFEIGAGTQLDSIVMISYSTADGAASFFALDDGPTFEFTAMEINDQFLTPDLADFDKTDGRGGILGSGAFGLVDVGQDFLDNPDPGVFDLEASAAQGLGEGFIAPLGPGFYSMYIQETGAESNYTLGFNVSSATGVPEASHFAALTAAGFGYLGVRRSRRRRLRKSASDA